MLEHEDFPPWWYLRLAFVWNATHGERDRVLAEEERVYHTVSPLTAVATYFWNVFL